jgi:protein FAM50
MYIKEDLIIPMSYTFYDLIVTKARGKSGPLFNFDVHDDVRLVSDVRIEKNESHAGKVVERRWYHRRHISITIRDLD